jgi:hypothetical protein
MFHWQYEDLVGIPFFLDVMLCHWVIGSNKVSSQKNDILSNNAVRTSELAKGLLSFL